ncbi:MAG: hypothetical protein KIT58_00885 [Planctomycetota bacterium]|nr:hypothetical protein [Planctomycetota bacterium]
MLPTVRRVLLVAGGLVTLAFAEEPPTFGPFGAECQVAFAPDGQALAVTTRGGSAALVARDDGRRLRRFRGERDESESAVAPRRRAAGPGHARGGSSGCSTWRPASRGRPSPTAARCGRSPSPPTAPGC